MRKPWMFLAAAAVAAPVWAVQPQRFVHTNEADFEPGEFEDTVATSLGDLKLASASAELPELPDSVTVVYDLVELDGATYVAAGPEATLLKIKDGEVTQVATKPGSQFFTFAVWNGELVVGVSGESSEVAVLRDGELTTLQELEGVRYVWDLLAPGGVQLRVALAVDEREGFVRTRRPGLAMADEQKPRRARGRGEALLSILVAHHLPPSPRPSPAARPRR